MAAVVGSGGRNSPEISYFARAADPRPSRAGSGTFNLDKIVPFIRREAYRKPHVDRWHRATLPNRSNSYLGAIVTAAFRVYNQSSMKEIA